MEMIHANHRWKGAVTTNLWPYALRMANDSINAVPSFQNVERKTPQQMFAGTSVNVDPKHWKPFGCPVYVLDTALQSSHSIFHKWKQRSRVGIYIGRSPQHGRNVALVLDRVTGLVSPQFHVQYDPSFHTVKQDTFDSTWQIKAGFVQRPLQENNKSKSKQETVPPAVPKNKRKRSSDGVIPASEGAN
eukprot:scaffold231074_cov49-Attheya_sp.AAC.1